MALRNRTARLRPALAPATLAMLTACLMAPAPTASADDVNFTDGRQVGLATVVSVDGVKRPVEFVVDDDGSLWEFERLGSYWTRTNRGTPANVAIVAGAGAVGVDQGVRAYVVGDDGNLWQFRHDGASYGWTKLVRPQGSRALNGAVGTGVDGKGARFVVARDDSGRLWQYKHNGQSWVPEDMGKMPNGEGDLLMSDVGVGTFNEGAYAFTISNRNVLWSVHKTTDGKWVWTSWGTARKDDPVWSPLGVITYKEQNELVVFLQSNDARVWRVSWDAAAGSGAWKEFAAPASRPAVHSGGGAVPIPGGEQVTLLGKDGKLSNTVNGHMPSAPWYGTRTPANADLRRELGSRSVADDSYTFTVDSDGDVWVARFTPADLSWKWTEIRG
ncbi:hypothetical protein [Streptomyces sp. MA5143a]|uniref:hypothetical protein n=1 Tax=Streptomyces sp. MA5143a TaxID=2083010 RepID=UPI000D1B45DE|nr:hypothetical protein [Streptomyces sp. MA5143a]SPF04816.1 hypothetical protein SMA5143A_5618 [Streptomyces sp. MA5143a]